MVGTRSNKKKTTEVSHDENQAPSITSPSKKMTKQEKAEARARARASILPVKNEGDKTERKTAAKPGAKPKGGTPKKVTTDNSKDSTIENQSVVKDENELCEKLQETKIAEKVETSDTKSTAEEVKPKVAATKKDTTNKPPRGFVFGSVETPNKDVETSNTKPKAQEVKPKIAATKEDTKNMHRNTNAFAFVNGIAFTFGSAEAPSKAVAVPKLKGVGKLLLVDLQQENKMEVKIAVRDLGALTTQHDKELNFLGAGSILVLALNKWSSSLNIQHNGWLFLSSYSLRSRAGAAAMIKGGAIEAIFNAMERFPSSPLFQGVGCRALMALSSFPGDEPANPWGRVEYQYMTPSEWREAWHPFLHDFDGVSVIANAIRALENMPDALADCANLLSNLVVMDTSADESVKRQIREVGAQTLMYSAKQMHFKHHRLRKAAGALTEMF